MLIETHELTKRYGDFVALDGCSLSVHAGTVFGLLGPNGAGKTTLIRLLLGCIFPTSGWATIDGRDCRAASVAVRRQVAYLPGDARLPRHMRGRSVLEFFAGVHPEGNLQRSLEIARQLDLDLNRRVAFMSTGMRQKAALCAVLGMTAPVLILDEPTANLDPTVRGDVLRTVAEARREGRTVLFSSHVLSEIEEACDHVAFLRRGRLVHEQEMAELHQRHRIVARVAGQLPPLPPHLRDVVEIRRGADGEVAIETGSDLAPLLSWLATSAPERMRIEPAGLRSLYESVHRGAPADEVAA